MRDINIMNPGYIQDVFTPIYSYSIQDGMNQKLIPYPRQGERYTSTTADYFINGVDGEPLKWGNLNSDIYVDPISLNMGTVQRQSMLMLAYDKYMKGDTVKAKQLLDLAEANFPAPNFPNDIYSVYVATNSVRVDVVNLYKEIYGIEKARTLWENAFRYYDQEISYLSQFKGEKAAGVRSALQSDLQFMSLLSDMADQDLNDDSLSARCKSILSAFNTTMYYN